MTKSRNLIRKRWRPTAEQIELVRARFARSKTQDLADELGVAYNQVAKLAQRLGLHKDQDWLNGPAGGRLNGTQGAGNRFQPGHLSWITGLRLPGHGNPATWFKPGQKCRNWLPIGSFRHLSVQGYLQIKLHDTGYPPHDWVMYHRHVWEQANGPIPPGHIVAFKDGIKRTRAEDITLDVLELRTKREHMLKNTVHNLGPELAHTVLLRAAITRQINRQSKEESTHE